MAKITDGIFKDWQETETIHANEYKQEREIIRVAVNDNDTRLSELEVVTDALQLESVQLQKITDDTGGVKLTTVSTSDDILAIILAAGKGMHTFYAVSGSKNLPPTNLSIRGIAHFTSATIGWVYATDYQNNIFTNYYDTTKWSGWRHLVSNADTQEELWSGSYYMHATQTVTPTKKLTDCRNGWILVWSDYTAGDGANNYDFHYSYVPKFIATKHNGSGHLFSIPQTPSSVIVKNVGVFNDKLTGDAANGSADDDDSVLRYVLEW